MGLQDYKLGKVTLIALAKTLYSKWQVKGLEKYNQIKAGQNLMQEVSPKLFLMLPITNTSGLGTDVFE